MISPLDLTLAELVDALSGGSLSAVELTTESLNRLNTTGRELNAVIRLLEETALTAARASDQRRASGDPLGPLDGIPVGIKDLIDTADMPTSYGSPIYAGHRPAWDAASVALLRAAGAVILGKTVTTEFAMFTPGKTANPHNVAHTPGGSSSGSAAAVAGMMVPLALGTQTSDPMGLHAFCYGAATWAIVRLRQLTVREHPATQLLITFAFTFLVQVTIWIALRWLAAPRIGWMSMIGAALVTAAYTGICAPALHWMLHRLHRWTGLRNTSRAQSFR